MDKVSFQGIMKDNIADENEEIAMARHCDLEFTGVSLCTQGALLNISSFLGTTGSIGQANPAAAKARDIGLLLNMQSTVSLVSFRSILLHYFFYAAHSSLQPCF